MSGDYTRGGIVTVVAVTGFVTLLIGVAVGRGSIDGLREWQTTLGAFITLAAVVVAVWNVRRQLRMTLIAREEALMEERHPGLEQAVSFVMVLNIKLSDPDIYKTLPDILQEYKMRGSRDIVMERLGNVLTLTDIATKHMLLNALGSLNWGADLIEEGSDLSGEDELILETAAGMVSQGRSIIDGGRASLNKIEVLLSGRLKRRYELLPRFRAEIEAYFDR
jgi:hypothetical protein